MKFINNMDVLSLFDGISCARVALERAGIPIKQYIAVEIDEKARQITMHNFPDTLHLNDVRLVSFTAPYICYDGVPITIIDPSNTIILGGSPCQGFSLAGKQLNLDDPRSALFFEFKRIRDEIGPKLWLLENVRMRKCVERTLSKHLCVDAMHINSKYFAPLIRPRLYWFNWHVNDASIPRTIQTMEGHFDTPENIARHNVILSDAAVERCKKIELRARQRNLGYRTPIVTGDTPYRCLDKNIHKGADGKRGVILDGVHPLRMPTPVECERCQGLPDGYTQTGKMSKTARYKALGNAWTVPVVSFLLQSAIT